MSRRIWAIALNTFREAVRNRVLYAILVGVVGFLFSGTLLGECSLHEEARVTRDVGLAVVSLFGSLTAIVLGVLLLYGEIQRRTIHTIVSKPLERWEFVVGKFTGMALTLSLLVSLFAVAMLGLLLLQGVPLSVAIFKALALSYVEVLVIAATAIFFSSFSSPYLSGAFTLGLFLIGRFTPWARQALADKDVSWLPRAVSEGVLYLVPDLDLFHVSGGTVGGEHVSVHDAFVGWDYVAYAAGHGLLYIVLFLLLAAVIFSRRDFV